AQRFTFDNQRRAHYRMKLLQHHALSVRKGRIYCRVQTQQRDTIGKNLIRDCSADREISCQFSCWLVCPGDVSRGKLIGLFFKQEDQYTVRGANFEKKLADGCVYFFK